MIKGPGGLGSQKLACVVLLRSYGLLEGLLHGWLAECVPFSLVFNHRKTGRFSWGYRVRGRYHQIREFSLALIKK